MQLYLFEVTAALDEAGTEKVFYFAHGGAYKHPSAPAYYPDRLQNPINIVLKLSDNLRTLGSSSVSTGEVVIDNTDGAYDALLDYGYNRQARVLKVGQTQDYAQAEVLFDGFIEQPEATSESAIRFRFRDRREELKKSLQPAKFLGTNVGGAGLEGTADDIGGTPKPRLFGKALNISPVAVNGPAQIYAWNYDRLGTPAASYAVLAARDGGVALVAGANYATLGELLAATVPAGSYATCLAASMLKCGSKPIYDLTMDVVEASTNAGNSLSAVIERVLLDAGVPSARIDAASFAATALELPYRTGYYAREEISTGDVADMLAVSAGAYLQPNGQGVYELRRFAPPSGAPAVTLRQAGQQVKLGIHDADVIAVARVVPNDEGRGVPVQQITLGYARNWTQQSNFAGAASAEVQERYRSAERVVSTADAGVAVKYPHAPEISFSTLLTEQADAEAELARRMELYATERAMFEVQAKYTKAIAPKLQLGAEGRVYSPRFGLVGGRDFIITQLDINARVETAKITVWG